MTDEHRTLGENGTPEGAETLEGAESPEGAETPEGAVGQPATYANSGVDLSAGDEVVSRIRDVVASTARPGARGSIGAFAGLFALDTDRFPHPVLVSSTDGVGTKMLVAQATGRFDTIGLDLVAMCVDDVVCSGAEPLFLLDYVAVGKLVPERVESIVRGIAEGCRVAGCALVGGETAEHPGAMGPDDVDLAGFVVGVVEAGRELGPQRVAVGDVLVALPSPGLRSNGYTLARHVLLERAGLSLDGPAWDGATHSVADELLTPSVVYAPAVLAALRACATAVHACAHVTGGGIQANLSRVLPRDADAVVERGTWEVPRVFVEIARLGRVTDDEMARVFNLGLGMILLVEASHAETVVSALRAMRSVPPAVVVGEIVAGTGTVRM